MCHYICKTCTTKCIIIVFPHTSEMCWRFLPLDGIALYQPQDVRLLNITQFKNCIELKINAHKFISDLCCKLLWNDQSHSYIEYHTNTKEQFFIYTCTDENWCDGNNRVCNASENVQLM